MTECDKFFMRGVVTDLGPFDSLCRPFFDIFEYLQPPIMESSSKNQNGGVLMPRIDWKVKLKSSLFSNLLVPTAIILLIGTWAVTRRCNS